MSRWSAMFVFFLWVLFLPLLGYCGDLDDAADVETSRFAVVIGVNDPDSEIRQRLRYADDDALAMHELLREAGVESRLLVTLDDETQMLYPNAVSDDVPTLDALEIAVDQLREKVRAAKARGHATELIFFYSGHGDVHRGEGFVVLRQGRLTRTHLFESVLIDIGADKAHVVIDACKSYYMIYDKGPGGERVPYPYAFTARAPSFDTTNIGVVLSASSGRESHEWERYQAGIFSHEVRSAFRGAADLNRDGRITYAELGAFLTVANKGIVNQRFRPQFLVQPPGAPPGDLEQPILSWQGKSDTLAMDMPAIGHFYVENALGIRFLDVHADKRDTLRLFLPSQRPLFVRSADETKEFVIENKGSLVLSTLQNRPVQIASKGALHLAFAKLFDAPFSASHVAAFKRDYNLREGATLKTFVKSGSGKSVRETARWAALWTAGGSVLVGGAMTAWAVERYRTAKDASQREMHEINATIRRLNTTAIVFYSLAGVAGGTWLTLTLLPKRKRASTVTLAPMLTPEMFSLGVGGTLPLK